MLISTKISYDNEYLIEQEVNLECKKKSVRKKREKRSPQRILKFSNNCGARKWVCSYRTKLDTDSIKRRYTNKTTHLAESFIQP